MATLAEVEAEIVLARDALRAASFAQSYNQGDRNLSRAPITHLEQRLARLCRERDELTAAAAGATNPMMVTAVYR